MKRKPSEPSGNVVFFTLVYSNIYWEDVWGRKKIHKTFNEH